jgi:predicted Zn-dependent protease
MVLEGNAKEAETRARPALERVKVSTVVAAWQAVLAHALVAQGARDEAVTILEEMKKSHGDAAIARVVRQNGPASPLAESMQADTGTPYR